LSENDAGNSGDGRNASVTQPGTNRVKPTVDDILQDGDFHQVHRCRKEKKGKGKTQRKEEKKNGKGKKRKK